jgi:copper chaperone CopZ
MIGGNLRKIVFLLVLLLVALSFAAEEKIVISIEGMTSKDCVDRVKTALEKVEGVKSVEVKLKSGEAIVVYDTDEVRGKDLLKPIAASGYKIQGVKTDTTTAAQPDTSSKQAALKATKVPQSSESPDHKAISTSHKQEGYVCPTIKECKELIEFHKAMHPMHMALAEKNYEAVCNGYQKLAEKAEAIKMMVSDEKHVKDAKAFEEKRNILLKTVVELGDVCKAKDDKKLTEAFDRMHEAYIELGNLAK